MDVAWAAILANRRRLVIVAIAGAVIGFLGSFLIRPVYRSSATLAVVQPPKNSSFSQFSSIAGAFGFSLGEGYSSLDLYSEYLKSRDLLESIMTERIPMASGDTTTILDQWGGDPARPRAERVEDAVDRFESQLQVRRSEAAGTLKITVGAFDPESARAIAEDFVDRLNVFDAEIKRWSAGNRSEELQARVTEVMRNLSAAEDSLTSFRIANRRIEHPRVRLEEMRLMREVSIQTELLRTLRVELELAKIEARGQMPVLKTIEHARAPIHRSWPKRGRIAGVVSLLALLSSSYLIGARASLESDSLPSSDLT